MKMFLQAFHCDAHSVASKAATVQIFKLSHNYYVRAKRVTGVGAGALQADLQPGGEGGGGGQMGQKLKEYDFNSPVFTSTQ